MGRVLNGGKKMKKSIFILLSLIVFASSASATIYSWVDEKGVTDFADDYSKVPPEYRNKVKELDIQKMGPSTPSQPSPGKIAVSPESGKTTTAPPPIGQILIREGDFAVKLTEVLKVGQPQSEAEAENMLSSIGVTPQNGWIADYPMTPDIIGELQNAIGTAADSGKLGMKKDEAMKTFQELTAQQGLPIRGGTETQNAGAEQPPAGVEPPQNYPEYYEPSAINDYYYDQGPPIVTYYPPPWDYYYMYAWVPYPFWCAGFWFPGFFCLHDFHRGFFVHGNQRFISNHFWDSRARGFGTIDPTRRHMGNAMANISHPARGFSSREASNGASSILRRSSEHTGLSRPMGGISSNRGSSGLSNFRSGVRHGQRSRPRRPGGSSGLSNLGSGVSAPGPSRAYRPPSTGYSSSRRVPFGRPTYGSSSNHPGSFSHPGMRTGRSFSSRSSSGSLGSHGGGFGSRGFSGGGGRGRR
jgi:hypothetical protein